MQLPPHVKNNPNFTLLSNYFSPEEVVSIVESRIPINRPGVVPSLQVPPGAKDCDQIPVIDIDGMGQVYEAWDPRGYEPHLSPEIMQVLNTPMSPLVPSCQCITSPCNCGTSMEPARYQTQVSSTPDMALSWVNDNWLMIAGALGGLFALSVLTKK